MEDDLKFKSGWQSELNVFLFFVLFPPQDSDKQLTVLTDRSQGGSSIKDGQVELMVS